MVEYFIGEFTGRTNERLMLFLGDEDLRPDVTVYDRRNVRRKATIVPCTKTLAKRLKERDEDPPLRYVMFWRRQPGQRIVEVPPKKKAGWELAQLAKALKATKVAAGTSSSDTAL